METIKVIIADDHRLYRTGIKIALGAHKNVAIIGEAENGMHLLDLLKDNAPDVILLDVQMPVMDGITVLPQLKKRWPTVKVIMLTMVQDKSVIAKLMELGANSYLSKTSDIEIIHEAIVTCAEQEYYYNSLTEKYR